MKSFWWLALIAAVLACGGTATLAPSPVAQTVLPPTVASPQTVVQPTESMTKTATKTAVTATINPDQPTPIPGQAINGPVVRIGSGEVFAYCPVELALTADEQIQGLSGRLVLEADTGMLFVYEMQRKYSFWMPDMHFPLDIVWIGSDCTVADVTLNALPPEPGQASQDLLLYSPKTPVQYVLEINAGEAEAKGIKAGVGVEFLGGLAEKYGC